MSASSVPSHVDFYREHLADFHEIEDFMGEVAELVAHVADALSHFPDDVDVSPAASHSLDRLNVDERDWPSFARLQSMLQTWRTKRNALVAAWGKLNEQERIEAGPLPPFGAPDPTRVFV